MRYLTWAVLGWSLWAMSQDPVKTEDKLVGKETFEVLVSGDIPVVRPVNGVVFGLQPINDAARHVPIPKGFAICQVLARNDNATDNKVFTTVVLKCGEYEYGIRDVLFNGIKNGLEQH